MTPELRGIPYRSNPEVFQLGAPITFKPDYLQNARSMDAPEVWGISIVFTGTVGAITGGALGRDAAKLFDNIRFRDTDDVLNASGAGLRVVEQVEFGSKQIDPADITSGSTNATYRYLLKIPFALPWRSRRPRDYAIPTQNFLDGGEFTIQTAAAVPTGWNAVQADWRIQLFADVRDGRVPELKSRRRIKEEAVTQQEFDYQINGALRGAYLSSKLTTTGYTTLAAFTTLNSRTLKWPASFQTPLLVDEYRREATVFATNDEFLLAAPGAIPIVSPRQTQKIGNMVMTKSLHLDLLAAAPTNGRLITDVLIDRNPVLSSNQLGYDGPGPLAAAIKQHGVVVGAVPGANYQTRAFNGELARKMPLRIKSGKMT
jgi:hypothetical protein